MISFTGLPCLYYLYDDLGFLRLVQQVQLCLPLRLERVQVPQSLPPHILHMRKRVGPFQSIKVNKETALDVRQISKAHVLPAQRELTTLGIFGNQTMHGSNVQKPCFLPSPTT